MAQLRLRSVRRASTTRARSWLERIDAAEKDVAVGDLYAGESWFVARRASSEFDHQVQLWALSAGFGLVRFDEPIASYDATLSSGHPDSVYRPGDRLNPRAMRRRWWSELSAWEGGSLRQPRSVTALADMEPSSAMAVCAGSDYLDATADDLVRARHSLDSAERMLIFGVGQCPDQRLQGSWIPIPARLRSVLSGSLGSLSIRTAERMLHEIGSDIAVGMAREKVRQLCEGTDDLPRLTRKSVSDDEISEWIVSEADNDRRLTKTVALRRFRDKGFACEQARFGRLFIEVQEALA